MTKKIAQMNRRCFLQLSAGAGAGIMVGGLSLSEAVWADTGKVLKARSYSDINRLDPGFYGNAYNVDVMNCIYSNLTHYKSGTKWGWELQAAENLEQIDPTHIRFRLKKGIEFTGDYGELTAEDVKFSFERIIKHNSPVKGDWGSLDRVEVEDDYNGVIVLSKPFVPIWHITLPYGAGCIVSKKAVMEATQDGSNFGMKPPAFSGPYILADWKPKQKTVLTRNPKWQGPKPGFDEIHIYPIEDVKTAQRSYQAGDIDFTEVSADSIVDIKKNPPSGTKVQEKPSLYYVWVGMNMDNPALKDANLRKAIQWAINVQQIVDMTYAGQANVATGMIAPGLVGHRDKALVPPKGDLDKARDYLKKAGVSSPKLTIDIVNRSKAKTIAQVVQAQLAQIGITLEINTHDAASFATLGNESSGDSWKDLQLILNRFSMLPDPYYATEFFTCSEVGVWNWERFCSKKFDELNAKAVTIKDEDKRADMYHQMQDLMEQSGAYRFITNEVTPLIYRDTVMQATTRPDGRPLFRQFESVSS